MDTNKELEIAGINKPISPKKSLSLDVDTPEALMAVLRDAADKYYESTAELQGTWQDKKAGKIWTKIAVKFESIADMIEKEKY